MPQVPKATPKPVVTPTTPVANASSVAESVASGAPAAGEPVELDADGKPIKKKRVQKRTPRAMWGNRNAEGNLVTPIADGQQPVDYDRKKFLPLHKADFANTADFIEWLAVQFDQKAANLHKKAIEERSLGSVADRAKAKKLRSLHAKLAALEKELTDEGLDVAALLKD